MKARFDGFLQQAPDAVVIADARGLVVIANRPAEELFGFACADLVGSPLVRLIPARFRDPLAIGTGAQLFGLRRDGTEVPIDVHFAPLDTDDGPLVAATVRDSRPRLAVEAHFEPLYRAAEAASRPAE